MSDICTACKCKCILVSESCIYSLTYLNAESKILIKHAHVLNFVHDFEILPILGDCLSALCEAKSVAIKEAIGNGTNWEDEIDPQWLLIVNDTDFQGMYANFVEYYILKRSTGLITGDGLVERDRSMEQNSGISRQASTKKADRYAADALMIANKYKERFCKTWDDMKSGFDCTEPEVCNPCQDHYNNEIQVIPGFAKKDKWLKI